VPNLIPSELQLLKEYCKDICILQHNKVLSSVQKKFNLGQVTCIQVVYQHSQFLMSMSFKSQFFGQCQAAPHYTVLRPTFETNEEAWLSQI
jgi:hypothetical protein